MKDYQYILFDLDGTITDSQVGIINSVIYALKKYGIVEEDREKLRKFIGPPLAHSFMTQYGFSEGEAKTAIDYYREYYSVKGIFENEVYDGLEDALIGLKEAGKTLLVATSKPEYFAKQILEHFHLTKYFSYIAGATMDEKRVNKDEVIAYALESQGITDKSKVLMVGDREHDIIGAKKNGLDSMGVLFGFGDREELEAAGADYIVETARDMFNLLV